MDGVRELTKRERRHQKRAFKRAGSQRRRRMLKQALRENPEGALSSEIDFGRFRTAQMNGMDKDPTRRRARPSQDRA
jgi:hypothetical protein